MPTNTIPININRPGAAGVNKEQAGAILPSVWATELDNAVFDSAGRPAGRKGFLNLTVTPGTDIVKRIFEYYKADGTSEVIYSTDSNIYKDTTTATSIEGTLGVTDGNIKFANFNDKVIAFGIGTAGIPAVRTTGDFADITVNSGTAPTSRIGMSAFGRLWGVDTDGKTIRYSALLDETRWAEVDGGGFIDMSQVWPSGQDSIVAIEELQGDIVVFGSNNTVVWTDGVGSSLGILPDNLYVSDTVPGQGAISQHAIARANGDLWVLTSSGIFSLGRELVQRSTPINNISRYVQTDIIEAMETEIDLDQLTMEYSPEDSLVVLCLPDSGRQFVFDTRAPLEEGAYRSTTWSADIQTLRYIRGVRKLYGSLVGEAGSVMEHSGNEDNGGTFAFTYESGWLELGEEIDKNLKFVKRIASFVFIEKNVSVTYSLQYDFGLKSVVTQAQASGGQASEWNNFEWGDNGVYDLTDPQAVPGVDWGQWSGNIALRTIDVQSGGSGQYIKVGLRLDTNSGGFALQQLNLYAKLGRQAT